MSVTLSGSHCGLPLVIAPLANLSLLAANPLYDRVAHGRMHPVSLWGSVLFVILANILGARSSHRA